MSPWVTGFLLPTLVVLVSAGVIALFRSLRVIWGEVRRVPDLNRRVEDLSRRVARLERRVVD